MRKAAVLSVLLGSLVLVPSADAVIPDVFGGDVSCSVAGDGVRECGSSSPRSTTATFDGMPIDVNVAFPPDPGAGDGNFPLLIWGHGYGGRKFSFAQMRRFTSRGYAVFSMTARGFHESCGTPLSKTAGGAACDDGYVRLMDTRYEVRDAQEFAAELADEDVVDPQRVGALGGSYGGGLSMALAALKDRKMLPDGSLVPWISPVDSEPMRIAGASPNIPWTDLAYSLVPSGGTLDYVTDSSYDGRFGVMKQSLVNGLYLSGLTSGEGFYCPQPCPNPDADLTGWKARLDAGEPYDGDPTATSILTEIKAHHSSYYIGHGQAPAPMLISSGFTDDLFPADEAIRFYNRTVAEHPGSPISLFFGDFGHQRASNKTGVTSALTAREDAWLDFYVKGAGGAPAQGVETFTQTCPTSSGTPGVGPFKAPNWASIAPGEVRHSSAAPQTITAGSGSTSIAATFDPVSSGGNPCRSVAADDQAGVASYRLPAVPGAGYTLMGPATVIADINSPAPNSELAARLLDVDPATNQETLVSRGVLRPAAGSARQVFQLHPNGWKFASGHIPKLELLPRDAGDNALSTYLRQADGQGAITVSNLDLRLPVVERPGALASKPGAAAAAANTLKAKKKKSKKKSKKKKRVQVAVKVPEPKFVPAGYSLAKDFAAINTGANAAIGKGALKQKGKRIGVKVSSPGGWVACHATTLQVRRGGKKGKVLAKGAATVAGGKVKLVRLKLTKAGKRLSGRAKVTVKLITAEQEGAVLAKRTARFKG